MLEKYGVKLYPPIKVDNLWMTWRERGMRAVDGQSESCAPVAGWQCVVSPSEWRGLSVEGIFITQPVEMANGMGANP